MTLTQPDSMFNQYMAVSPGTIESQAFLEQDGADYGNPSTGVELHRAVRVRLLEVGPEHHPEAVRRLLGHRRSRPRSAEVKFVFLQDPNTRVNAWQNGEVDGGWNVPSNGYTQLQNGGPGTLYYGLNTTVVSQIVSNLRAPGRPEGA